MIFISAIILGFLFIFFNKQVLTFVNILDRPDNKRKLHNKVSYPVGGILIFLNLSLFIVDLFIIKNFNISVNISLTGRESLVLAFGSF